MANQQFYLFQAGSPRLEAEEKELTRFFDRIQFAADKVRENSYTVDSVYLK
jgi:hypothetical protein